MILNIRGPSGSGKSTIVKELIAQFKGSPLLDEKGRIEAYHLDHNIYIIGPYESHRKAGGCDAVRSLETGTAKGGVARVDSLVRKYASVGHVIFEGLIITGVQGRFYQISKEFGEYIWAFLDTPVEVCYQRVIERSGRPPKMEYIIQKYKGNQRIFQVMSSSGEHCIWIDHTKAYEQVLEILAPILGSYSSKLRVVNAFSLSPI